MGHCFMRPGRILGCLCTFPWGTMQALLDIIDYPLIPNDPAVTATFKNAKLRNKLP